MGAEAIGGGSTRTAIGRKNPLDATGSLLPVGHESDIWKRVASPAIAEHDTHRHTF